MRNEVVLESPILTFQGSPKEILELLNGVDGLLLEAAKNSVSLGCSMDEQSIFLATIREEEEPEDIEEAEEAKEEKGLATISEEGEPESESDNESDCGKRASDGEESPIKRMRM